MITVTTTAPAKAILFGEHAVNRGQVALAVSVGLRMRCTVRTGGYVYHFEGAGHARTFTKDEVVELGMQVDAWREAQAYEHIRALAAQDYFAPAKYIISTAMRAHAVLQDGLDVAWHSEIPHSGGLGSGGAASVALATALHALADSEWQTPNAKRQTSSGELAYLGDVIAHGGVASALDTQTSLLGGVIRYTKEDWGQRIPCADGLTLVIGDTGQRGQTSAVNTRVREWLAADATRMRYFEMVGVLSADAQTQLASGNWQIFGKLMNMNQLVLEKIGVSSPELERLIDAAIGAGAFGAKLSGSGGGGIMIALTAHENRAAVAAAITQAGGRAFTPDVAVEGAKVES
jgi:mevalonate kinase